MGGGYNHENSKSIDAMLLDTASDDFIILTKQEINNYPHYYKVMIVF